MDMDDKSWLSYKIMVRKRLKLFALAVLNLSEKFPNTTRAKVVNYQLTKSGTSVYANYRATLRARSKREFFSKLSIVVEEADETEMWLDLIMESGIMPRTEVKPLYDESLELLKILAKMRKNNQ